MESRRDEREKRSEERRGDFKKGITSEGGTDKRAEEMVSLRKQKRDKQLKRIRRLDAAMNEGPDSLPAFTEDQARHMMVVLQTGSAEQRSAALRALRQLTASDEPRLELLHNMHIVQVLQKVLTGGDGEDRINALWCLTNLASGSHETTVPLYAVVPHIVNLLESNDLPVADQAAWCLGNIAGDCPECRARVISAGSLTPLMALLKKDGPPGLLVTLGFTFCNLVRGGGALADLVNRGLIALVLRLLTPVQDLEVVVEMSWLLTYISAGEDVYKANIVSMGGLDLLLQLCMSGPLGANPQLMIPVIRTLGNLAAAPDQVVMHLINNRHFLQSLWSRLGSRDNNILKEVCWTLRNLSGGPREACAALAQTNFVPPLAALLNGSVMAVRKEVGFVLLNMVSALRENTPILGMLAATPGVMESFIEFLGLPDGEMIGLGLRWASYVLRFLPQGKESFEEAHGLTALEDLEYNVHKDDKLFSRANELIHKYFDGPDDEEQHFLAEQPQQGGFHF